MSVDARQSQEYLDMFRLFGHVVEDLGSGQGALLMTLKPIPFLNALVVQRVDVPQVLPIIDKLAKHHHSLFVKIAPAATAGSEASAVWEAQLRKHGFKQDKTPVAPSKTLVVNLNLSESELLSQMKPKTRYNIRLAQRRGVTVKVVDGAVLEYDDNCLNEFYATYSEHCRHLKVQLWPKEAIRKAARSFGRNLFAILAYTGDGKVGSVGTFMVSEDTVTYMLAGSTEQGRHDFASNLLLWEAMLEGQRRGCRWFDFDGLIDDRYQGTEDWEGFSRFKLGFGGEEVIFMGSYIKWVPFLRLPFLNRGDNRHFISTSNTA